MITGEGLVWEGGIEAGYSPIICGSPVKDNSGKFTRPIKKAPSDKPGAFQKNRIQILAGRLELNS